MHDVAPRSGRARRTRLKVVVAAAALLLIAVGVFEFPGRGTATLLGSTDPIDPGTYAPWQVGDTHVHLVGDSGVLFNNRCRPNERQALDDVMGSLQDCAKRLVDATHEIASHNGLDWVMLTEHGPWLGSPQLSQCTAGFAEMAITLVASGIAQPAQCVRHATTFYSYSASVDAWTAIRSELADLSPGGPDLLLGQEIGTAAGISTLCTRGIANLPFAARYGPGHVGVYSLGAAGLPLRNTIFDCDETEYLEWLEAEGFIGAINHPDNGDGGSDWHCWSSGDTHPNGDPCRRGVETFTRSVLPRPADAQVPPPASVVGVAIVSDTKAPTPATISNVLTQLRAGHVLGFVAGSDSHAITRERNFSQSEANDGKIGLAARTYAFAPGPAEDGAVDAIDHPVRFALANQATIASLGPLLSPRIEGVRPGGTAAVDGTRARLVVTWPTETTWPHVHTGSGGYEITNDERVPRLNERPHRPVGIDVHLVAVGTDCSAETCATDPQLQFEFPTTGALPTAGEVVVGYTELDEGVLVADLDLPPSPTDRWAVVVRGRYGPDIPIAGGRTYPVDAWASPIWLDGSAARHATATDDRDWFPPDIDIPLSAQPSPAFTLAPGDAPAFAATAIRVVDQGGNPVQDAVVELHWSDGDRLVPLAARSGAIAPGDRYRPAYTDDTGMYAVSLLPGRYIATASAALCTAGPAPTTELTAGDLTAAAIVLECVDPDALPITIHAVSAGGADTLDVELTCERPDGTGFVVIETVPGDGATELARAPEGTICTMRQTVASGAPGTRLLADEVQTERVTLRGAEFVNYTTADVRPASFAIDARPLDPTDIGDSVNLSVWCPGFDRAREIEVVLGERHIVEGMLDGDSCAVTHAGDRLAFPPAPIHEVHVVGRVEAEPGHEGHDHEHDAIFSVVDLLFTSGPSGPRPPIPDTQLPPVILEPPPPGPACTAPFELDEDRCVRRVPPTPRLVTSDPECPSGWSQANDGLECQRTITERVDPTRTQRCPPGVATFDGACGELITTVPPTGTGDPTCSDGSQPTPEGCAVVEEQPPRCGELPPVTGVTCPVGTANCSLGWQLVEDPQRCVRLRFEPATLTSACPAGSRPQGAECVLDQPRLQPIDPIDTFTCPAAYRLEGDACVRTATETQAVQQVTSMTLECPDDSIHEGIDDEGPICLVIESPGAG